MRTAKLRAYLTAALVAITMGATPARAVPPNPILYLLGHEYYTVNGQNFVRYRYDVFNKDQYPAAMFAPAPALPPCGSNTNSSRSWVDFFNARTNQRIYGFCALGSPNDLGQIWFALPEGQIPPSYVYIKIIDRDQHHLPVQPGGHDALGHYPSPLRGEGRERGSGLGDYSRTQNPLTPALSPGERELRDDVVECRCSLSPTG